MLVTAYLGNIGGWVEGWMVVVVDRTLTIESDGSFLQITERESERIESKLVETSREYI